MSINANIQNLIQIYQDELEYIRKYSRMIGCKLFNAR